MNQEQVKEKLLQLKNDNIDDFKVIFSGKKSKKVNGLYYPEKKEIIIHNKNFDDDNLLIYTAIHEFAHHIHHCSSALPISSRAHTNDFWIIFQNLLNEAEKKGIYKNMFKSNKDFIELTKELRENYLTKNAEIMKNLGRLLIKAINLCQIHKVRFEDYVDRELLLNRSTADTMVKIYTMNINPEVGFDNMKILARVKDEEERKRMEEEVLEGKTQEMLKAEISNKKKSLDQKELLEKEKIRIKKTIQRLQQKLEEIEERMNSLN